MKIVLAEVPYTKDRDISVEKSCVPEGAELTMAVFDEHAENNDAFYAEIKDADIIGLTGIAAKSAELIEKAREGRLTEADYHGGTFTVSSLGMFDLDDFVAIINPPESAILAVGKIAKTPVVVTDDESEDQVVIKSMCALCLSYDHRIIDGAEAAKFLQKVKSYLQNPILLI